MCENASRTKTVYQGRGFIGLMRATVVPILRRKYPQLNTAMRLAVGNERQDAYIANNQQSVEVLDKSVNI
jgi:hypothetical protein